MEHFFHISDISIFNINNFIHINIEIQVVVLVVECRLQNSFIHNSFIIKYFFLSFFPFFNQLDVQFLLETSVKSYHFHCHVTVYMINVIIAVKHLDLTKEKSGRYVGSQVCMQVCMYVCRYIRKVCSYDGLDRYIMYVCRQVCRYISKQVCMQACMYVTGTACSVGFNK